VFILCYSIFVFLINGFFVFVSLLLAKRLDEKSISEN